MEGLIIVLFYLRRSINSIYKVCLSFKFACSKCPLVCVKEITRFYHCCQKFDIGVKTNIIHIVLSININISEIILNNQVIH